MKNSFFLVIPDQQKKPEQLQLFQEGALQQWLAELPTANPGLATRLLLDLIKEANKLEMSSVMRLEALELLRPNFLVIEDYLRSRLMKAGFPKQDNEQKIYKVLISLEKEFSIGYWITVRDLTRKSTSWFQGKNAVLSIHRLMNGLSDLVISHYMMGQTVPDWIWIDLHSLYKLAVKLKKESVKVADENNAVKNASTIQNTYRQILLLSLADPSGLMQKEILLVYRFVEKLCGLVELQSKPFANQQSQCVILIDEDKAPFFLETSKITPDLAILYLGFDKLFKALNRKEKYISESEARFSSIHVLKNKSDKLPVELAEYLAQRWSGIVLKGTPFFSDRLDRYFSIGLNSTHDLQASKDSSDSVVSEYHGETASESALSCKFDKLGVISIGSLVSFRKADMAVDKRSLGIVNKLDASKSDNTLSFEIIALTGQSHSATYLKLDATEDDVPQKALIYGVKSGNKEKSYLIIESFLFKNEDIVRLYLNNENFPILLLDKKNVGLGYWRFECRQLEEVEPAVKSTKGYDFI